MEKQICIELYMRVKALIFLEGYTVNCYQRGPGKGLSLYQEEWVSWW